jgi:DNA polymerase III subunit epsilon
MNFVAIDFETAIRRDSACAVGIVTVENGEIIEEYCQLIQPPGNKYAWYTTKVHGLTAHDTADAPTFLDVYPELEKRLMGKTVVAHNESFDRGVMQENMRLHGLDYSNLLLPDKWECTKLIYQRKGYKPCSLNALCDHFAIDLDHHEALSDARACAKLYLMR